MNKLIVSMAAAAALAAGGAAFAQAGNQDGQNAFAWGGSKADDVNSGWHYSYRGLDAIGQPIYERVPDGYGRGARAAAIYPPAGYASRQAHERHRYITRDARPRDRDGDGVRNNRDRYPDDSRRW